MTIAVLCIAPSAVELLGKARVMAPDARIIALCEGAEIAPYLNWGAQEAYQLSLCEDDCAQGTRIAQALRKLQPDAALFPATVRGRFLSAWVAAKLDTGLTADCTELNLTPDGLLRQTRPAFGGNLTADIVCKTHRPQLASVRPGVFPKPKPASMMTPVQPMKAADVPPLLSRLAFQPMESGISLQTARVVVTGGKGVGSKQGFDTLAELARLLGGAVGATRSAVDAGWIPYAHQIGQTGVTVRPELYLCFGVGGLIQHIVGMSGAKTVIAVNSDRNALIFRSANFGIIGDWETTAMHMIQYLKERKDSQ